MSSELATQVRNIAEQDLLRLRHPQDGYWLAGLPKFQTLYSRDAAKGSKLVFACPPHLIPDWFVQSTERSVELMVRFQGTKFDPDREEEEGVIFHELKNGHIPKSGFQAERPKVPREQKVEPYFGAKDTTSLFIGLVADLAGVKESLSRTGESYMRRMWPHVLAAYRHETQLADSSGYGLPDSIPTNPWGIYFQTEHDSDTAYLTEEGDTPRPPHFFLENSCHYVEALRSMSEMASIMGEVEITTEATSRYQKGKETIHEMFWMKGEGYYSPLVDGEGKQVKIITDDAIEGLWLKVFKDRFAAQVIERLGKPDISTDWGLRSRSYRSKQFALNGPHAYWNGNIWGQDTAKAAFGCENYGDISFAKKLDEELFRLVLRRGSEETVAVDEEGQLLEYRERTGGRPDACNPQLWTACGAFARAIIHQNRYLLGA